VKVAVAQLEAVALDPAENARRTCATLEALAGEGAELVVLPELVASGYVVDEDGLLEVAETAAGDGPVLGAWRRAAAELEIAVIGGFAERDGERLFNSVAVIDAGGELLGCYRKLHLFGAEKQRFAPGDSGLPIFEVGGVRVGVLVCYDLRFPESARLLALQGAELIAVPTAWVTGYDCGSASELPAQITGALVQANLNQVFIACADLCGEGFLGRSVIASPYGKSLAGPLGESAAGTALADVDPVDVVLAQTRADGVTPRADRRTDIYSLELSADPDALLADMERRRGYVLPLHHTLARRDPAFLAAYDAFLHAAFLEARSLDRRIKELIYVGVLTAVDTERGHLVAHMRAAVEHGATEREVLEVLEQVLTTSGVPRFIAGTAAFEEAFAGGDEG
jgi:predicted amidohydrolase/alkylhydroperoxidase/carboxymuconolactone decarboxylase family protein YurZ